MQKSSFPEKDARVEVSVVAGLSTSVRDHVLFDDSASSEAIIFVYCSAGHVEEKVTLDMREAGFSL